MSKIAWDVFCEYVAVVTGKMQGQRESSNEPEQPVDPVDPVDPVPESSKQVYEDLQGELASVQVKGDMLSHLENLEAEILATLDDTEQLSVNDSVTGGGVAVGGVAPPKELVTSEKTEVKETSEPRSTSKRIKVTSVQFNIRKSSRTEESKKVQSQLQPVKQVVQDPKPVGQPQVVQDPHPVKVRSFHQPVVKRAVQDPQTVIIKQEKKTSSTSAGIGARRSFM